MAAFTTEDAVRLAFQVNDSGWTPTALVLSSIDEAHEAILRRLDPAADTQSPAAGLVRGETLLAGACLLRSLASKDAVLQKDIVIGGQRIETGQRFAALMALSAKVEEDAWQTLEPFLLGPAGRCPASVTGTVPVLGEGG